MLHIELYAIEMCNSVRYVKANIAKCYKLEVSKKKKRKKKNFNCHLGSDTANSLIILLFILRYSLTKTK